MISVVIPLYNKESTILDTISTVINQTFQNFELIIVDDGSTDNSISLIKKTFKNKALNIIFQKNQGVSVARNTGVENSKYDLIAFLDGDDLWEKEYLETMYHLTMKYPEAGLYCCAGLVKNADGSIFKRITNKITDKLSLIDFFQNPHVFVHTSATIVNKDKFNKVGGFPPNMIRNQDYALFFSIALISKVGYCNQPLSMYVGGVPNQATSKFSIKILDSIIWRHNLVFSNWEKSNFINSSYLVFTKYELRHFFKTQIISDEYEFLNHTIKHLNNNLLNKFYAFEIYLYKRKSLRRIALFFINLTKLRWRLRSYPVFGR